MARQSDQGSGTPMKISSSGQPIVYTDGGGTPVTIQNPEKVSDGEDITPASVTTEQAAIGNSTPTVTVHKDGSEAVAVDRVDGEIGRDSDYATVIETAVQSMSAHDGEVVVLGDFELSRECLISDISDITVTGLGQLTMADGVDPASVLRFGNSSNFTVRRFHIDANKANNTGGSGYGLFVESSCSDYDVVGVTTENTYTHGILCGGDGWTVRECRVLDFGTASNSADGISSTNAAVSDSKILDNYVETTVSPPGSPHDIELQDSDSTCRIENNTCIGLGINYNNHNNGDEGLDNAVSGNTVVDGTLRFGGVSNTAHKRTVLANNTIVRGDLELNYCENIRVSGNTISVDDGASYGVTMGNCDGVSGDFGTVEYVGDGSTPPTDLIVVGNSCEGVRISPTVDGRVAGNDIVQGIHFQNTPRRSRNAVVGGEIKNVRRGVRFNGSEYGWVRGVSFVSVSRAVYFTDHERAKVMDINVYDASRAVYSDGTSDYIKVRDIDAEDVTTAVDLTVGSNNDVDSASVREFSSP